jgi:hypothetical protein
MSLLTAKFKNECISINDIPYNFYKEQFKDNLTCRCCSSQLQAVLQTDKAKHFRHASTDDCVSSTDDNLLLWHILWQSTVNVKNREYTMKENNKRHRADIYIPENDYVIEIQHSHIDPDKIKEREIFYKNIIWIIDGTSEINIEKLCDKCTKISDLCDKCLLSIKKDKAKTSEIVFEGKNFYIITIAKKFFLNMKEKVFIHCDGFICKFVAKLKGNNILCEKIEFKKLFDEYFLINDTDKIIDNFNKLYHKTLSTKPTNLKVDYVITDKLVINSDKSINFIDYGFEFMNGQWIFTYIKENDIPFILKERKCYNCNKSNEVCNQMVELNTKLCFQCNKNCFFDINDCETCKKKICTKEINTIEDLISQVKKLKIKKNLCEECHIKSITCSYCKKTKINNICDYCDNFTMRWYLMFNKEGQHSKDYAEIKIGDKIITINYNDKSNYKLKEGSLNIYYVDHKLINIIKHNRREKYRTLLNFNKGDIINTLDNHLFKVEDKKYDYTMLQLIDLNDFLEEIGINNNRLENDLELDYNYFDFDNEYSIFNDDTKFFFYKINFKNPNRINFYKESKILSDYSNKNRKALAKFMEFYEKHRNKSNDHHQILFGKDKGTKVIDLNLKDTRIYLQKNPVFNKDVLLKQNKNEIRSIFFN